MLKLGELKKHAAVSGIDPAAPVRIVSTEAIGDDALTVYYKTVDGTVLERMLFRADEAQLSLAQAGRPWAFDSSGDEVREVNPKGETVWQFTQADAPGYKLGNFQTANRLANGNTIITFWVAGNDDTSHWPGTVQVMEVTPAKKIVWAMSSWKDPDLGPATSIQLLDQPETPETEQR